MFENSVDVSSGYIIIYTHQMGCVCKVIIPLQPMGYYVTVETLIHFVLNFVSGIIVIQH